MSKYLSKDPDFPVKKISISRFVLIERGETLIELLLLLVLLYFILGDNMYLQK